LPSIPHILTIYFVSPLDEFAIALAENAVDNGVELRIRRQVTDITHDGSMFQVTVNHWEPSSFVQATNPFQPHHILLMAIVGAMALISVGLGLRLMINDSVDASTKQMSAFATCAVLGASTLFLLRQWSRIKFFHIPKTSPMDKLVKQAGNPEGKQGGEKVSTEDMLIGGSGSSRIVNGESVETETVNAKYVINCAGGASDKIARMIGDESFTIKPRVGDYLLLNRNQGYLTKHTLFPCPDPILGKGVLVQTTLWGNLILGPTARDMYKPEARDMSAATIQAYILSKCNRLVPYFDPKETFHAFCGARAKNSRGDWIIEPSTMNSKLIHVAGIDSPGLAGSPAIALEVVRLLQEAGCATPKNTTFNPNRAPIITPKNGMKGLKMGPVGKNDSDGLDEKVMAANVVCKCEKVTELEVVRALRRSLPIDSSQGIRKRTRAGMGFCQGDPENYCCEGRVRAIVARENGVPMNQVGGRPWPATSTLTNRWIDNEEKEQLMARMEMT
jgi:L-2-hydroxyglutarate oxidase LhgO